MIRMTIDGCEVRVEPGTTVLEAARRLGIEIPTLCHVEDLPPRTSCMVCLVRLEGAGGYRPACATQVSEGLAIESETPRVHALRREALELLMAEHLGDCEGPCRMTCPTFMNIPGMLRAVAAGETTAALRIVYEHMALPGVLGAVCPAPCEKTCRRATLDQPLPIRRIHRHLAETVLVSPAGLLDGVRSSGRRVAVVGAGPCGLSAAFHLLRAGHEAQLFDAAEAPGGALRRCCAPERLDPALLAAEAERILDLGATFQQSVLGRDESVESLLGRFDAVLLALGALDAPGAESLGLTHGGKGLAGDRLTGQTANERLFVAGACVRPMKLAVQAVAAGRTVALAMDRHLAGEAVVGFRRPLNVAMHALSADELRLQAAALGPVSAADPDELERAAAACLHCDCRKSGTCRLRHHAEAYGARLRPHRIAPRTLTLDATHPEVLLEPGKCIDCGICVDLCERTRDEPGLGFTGRGFAVRVAVPLAEGAAQGIRTLGTRLADACPTAAIVRRRG